MHLQMVIFRDRAGKGIAFGVKHVTINNHILETCAISIARAVTGTIGT